MMEYTSKTTEEMESMYTDLLSTIFKEAKTDNKNGSIVNILTNYDWSLNARQVSQSGAIPAVYVNEYRQKLSTFTSSLKYAATGVANSAKSTMLESGQTVTADNEFNGIISRSDGHLSPYYKMYALDKTNCLKYVFPYFSSKAFDISNTYGEKAQSGGAHGANTLDAIAKTSGYLGGFAEQTNEIRGLMDLIDNNSLIGDEGIYIERPKYFHYSESADAITVEFVLYNTVVNPIETSAWEKNYRFIKNFTLKNLPYKISYFAYKTPALYEVGIPGIKYFPVSFVSNFSATNIGMSRYLNYGPSTKVLVPEAWKVAITFQSLLNPSANILYTALNNGPIVSVVDGIDGKSTMKDPTDKMV